MPNAFCPTEKPKQALNIISQSLKKVAGFIKNSKNRTPNSRLTDSFLSPRAKNEVTEVLGSLWEGAGTETGPLSTQQCSSCSSTRPKSWLCLMLMPWKEHEITAPFWVGWCPCGNFFPAQQTGLGVNGM